MTRALDVIEDYLGWRGMTYFRLDGDTPSADRGPMVAEFNNPESNISVFLLSLRAGGVGLNLQGADTVIMYDTDWNPQIELQAHARAHRIGQKHKVLVLRLQTAGTIEERIDLRAASKRNFADASITGGFFDGHTSADDRRRYLLELLQSAAGPNTHGACDNDLNELLARSKDEKVLFDHLQRTLQLREVASYSKGGNKTKYSRLANAVEIAPLVSAVLQSQQSKGAPELTDLGKGKRARAIPKQSSKSDLSTCKALPHVPCRGHVKSTEPTGSAKVHASVAAVAYQEEQLLISGIKPALDVSRTSSPKGAITNCLETTLQSSGSHLKLSRAEHSEVCPIVSFSIDSISEQQDSGERPTGLEGDGDKTQCHVPSVASNRSDKSPMQIDWQARKVLNNAIEKVLPCHQGSAWGPSPDSNNPRAINPLEQESLAANRAKDSHDQHTSEEEADDQSLHLRSKAIASAPCKLELAQNASPCSDIPTIQPTHHSCTVEPHLGDSGEATNLQDSDVADWHSPLKTCQQNFGDQANKCIYENTGSRPLQQLQLRDELGRTQQMCLPEEDPQSGVLIADGLGIPVPEDVILCRNLKGTVTPASTESKPITQIDFPGIVAEASPKWEPKPLSDSEQAAQSKLDSPCEHTVANSNVAETQQELEPPIVLGPTYRKSRLCPGHEEEKNTIKKDGGTMYVPLSKKDEQHFQMSVPHAHEVVGGCAELSQTVDARNLTAKANPVTNPKESNSPTTAVPAWHVCVKNVALTWNSSEPLPCQPLCKDSHPTLVANNALSDDARVDELMNNELLKTNCLLDPTKETSREVQCPFLEDVDGKQSQSCQARQPSCLPLSSVLVSPQPSRCEGSDVNANQVAEQTIPVGGVEEPHQRLSLCQPMPKTAKVGPNQNKSETADGNSDSETSLPSLCLEDLLNKMNRDFDDIISGQDANADNWWPETNCQNPQKPDDVPEDEASSSYRAKATPLLNLSSILDTGLTDGVHTKNKMIVKGLNDQQAGTYDLLHQLSPEDTGPVAQICEPNDDHPVTHDNRVASTHGADIAWPQGTLRPVPVQVSNCKSLRTRALPPLPARVIKGRDECNEVRQDQNTTDTSGHSPVSLMIRQTVCLMFSPNSYSTNPNQGMAGTCPENPSVVTDHQHHGKQGRLCSCQTPSHMRRFLYSIQNDIIDVHVD
eukprot:jgi/Botrbrau1/11819/Bobra.0224s0017.2